MRALGRKKPMVFFGNARPKSGAHAHLNGEKKHGGLSYVKLSMCLFSILYSCWKIYLCAYLQTDNVTVSGAKSTQNIFHSLGKIIFIGTYTCIFTSTFSIGYCLYLTKSAIHMYRRSVYSMWSVTQCTWYNRWVIVFHMYRCSVYSLWSVTQYTWYNRWVIVFHMYRCSVYSLWSVTQYTWYNRWLIVFLWENIVTHEHICLYRTCIYIYQRPINPLKKCQYYLYWFTLFLFTQATMWYKYTMWTVSICLIFQSYMFIVCFSKIFR